MDCLLVHASFDRRVDTIETLFEKANTDTLCATQLPQSIGFPLAAFHHLGEQCQADGCDLLVLRQAIDRRGQKLFLIRRKLIGVLGNRM